MNKTTEIKPGFKIAEVELLRIAAKHRLPPLQIAFIREYLKNPNRSKSDIMLSAGYSPTSAIAGHTLPLRKARVISAIGDIIKAGKYDAKIAKTYDKIFDMQNKSGEDGTEIAIAKLQLDAAKEIHKITGDYAAKKVEKKELHAFADFGTLVAPSNDDANIEEGEIITDD